MADNRFPDGWDEPRVQRVIAHYEQQDETETLAKDKDRLARECAKLDPVEEQRDAERDMPSAPDEWPEY